MAIPDTHDETRERIERFLSEGAFAVVGASDDLRKYGAKVLRAYLQAGRTVYAVNPRRETALGEPCYPDLATLPQAVGAVSIITPPEVTEGIVEEAIAAGVRHLWMQPGAESEAAIRRAEEAGLSVIAGGPCVLVVLGYREGGVSPRPSAEPRADG